MKFIKILLGEFDVTDPDHIDFMLEHPELYTSEELDVIYNIVDVSVRNDCHQTMIDYNIKDVQIIDRLEDKMGLITLAMTIAYLAGVNLSDCFGPVGVWDAIIYNELRRNGIVCPPKEAGVKDRRTKGAFVKDPAVGAYKWIVSTDFDSLYPHIAMMFNMSPETILNQVVTGPTVEKLLNKVNVDIPDGTCMSATGQLFDITKDGIMPILLERLYSRRVVAKKQMLLEKQNMIYIEKELERRSIKYT